LSPYQIQAAANAASPGDTVVLPAGSYVGFNTTVYFDNGVSLRGQGPEATVLRRTSNSGMMLTWNYYLETSSYPVEISGFQLIGRGGGTSYQDSGIKLLQLVDFKVHDLIIRDVTATGMDTVEGRGVIYNCEFYDIYPADLGDAGYGVSVLGDDVWDTNAPTLGTQNMVFIENCYFEHCKHGIDANEDGRYVARYNEFHVPISNRAMLQVHGKQSSHAAGGRAFEIYANQFFGIENDESDWGMTIRGGTGVIWNNEFFELHEPDAYPPHKAIGFSIDNHGTYPADYPDPYQIRDTYVWGNMLEGRALTDAVRVTSIADDWVQENRDYFLYQKSGYGTYAYPHPLRGDPTEEVDLSISSVTESPAPGWGGTTVPETGTHAYYMGETVSIQAVPNSGYRFSGWDGDIDNSRVFLPQTSIWMNQDKSIVAHFCTRCGDVNGDLSVTPADSQLAFDIYLGLEPSATFVQLENADVNCDGTTWVPLVTPSDAQLIFQSYLGGGAFPGDCSGSSRSSASSASVLSRVVSFAGRGAVLRVDTTRATPGKMIEIPVWIHGPFTLSSFGFDLVFQSDALEYFGSRTGALADRFTASGVNQIAEGVLRIGGFNPNPVQVGEDSVLVTLIFRKTRPGMRVGPFRLVNVVDGLKGAILK
jgi:hypothetical protein